MVMGEYLATPNTAKYSHSFDTLKQEYLVHL